MAIKRSDYNTLAEYHAALNTQRGSTPAPTPTGTIKADLTPEAYQTYQNRLAGVGTTPQQNTALAAQKMTSPAAAAAREAATATALQKSKTINDFTFQDTPNAQAQLALNQKYNLPELTGMTGTPVVSKGTAVPGEIIAPEMARDYQRELEMAKKLGIDFGSMSQAEEKELFKATYSQDELGKTGLDQYVSDGSLGDLLKASQNSSGADLLRQLQDIGLTPDQLKQLENSALNRDGLITQLLGNLNKTGGELSSAKANLDATPAPSNASLGILQQALRAKSGVGNQQLGESDLYKAAGVGGYAVLAQSLAQHKNEMGAKYQDYASLVSSVGGEMNDTYKTILDSYKAAQDSWNKQADRLVKMSDSLQEHQFAMDKMAAEAQLKKEVAEWEAAIKAKYATPNYDLEKDEFGNPVGFFDRSTGTYVSYGQAGGNGTSSGGTSPDAPVQVGDSVVKKSAFDSVFGLGKEAGWCGTYSSTLSTAPKVGDSWTEKLSKVTHRDNPSMGDKLVLPLGVKSGKGYGHVVTVLTYNPETGAIYGVQSNADGRQNRGEGPGVVTEYRGNINELRQTYGNNWGFVDGDLKGEVKRKLFGDPNSMLGSVGQGMIEGAMLGANMGKQWKTDVEAPWSVGARAGLNAATYGATGKIVPPLYKSKEGGGIIQQAIGGAVGAAAGAGLGMLRASSIADNAKRQKEYSSMTVDQMAKKYYDIMSQSDPEKAAAALTPKSSIRKTLNSMPVADRMKYFDKLESEARVKEYTDAANSVIADFRSDMAAGDDPQQLYDYYKQEIGPEAAKILATKLKLKVTL